MSTVTKEQMAALLTGREYGSEITREEVAVAKASGLVVVFGYSDDNVELKGAIDDEVGCAGSSTLSITERGVLERWDRHEEKNQADARAYFEAEKLPSAKLTTNWCPKDAPGYSWTYSLDIPHATFEVVEDGEPYCRGIVFAVADLIGGAK